MKERGFDRAPCSAVILLGAAADLAIFYYLLHRGIPWNIGHLLSFLPEAAAFYFLWIIRKPGPGPAESFSGRVLGYLGVQFSALFLRGGALAALVQLLGWSPTLAILPAVAVSLAVALLADSLGLLHQAERRERGGLRRPLAIAVIVYAAALRLLYSGTFELLHEEAYYWNYAQHLDMGYLDHPPLVGWLIWLFTKLLGNSEFSVRVGALGCWLVTAYYTYKLAFAACGEAAALRSLVLVVVLPIFFCLGLLMIPDAPLVACWAGALYFLYRSLIEGQRGAWLGVGIFMGLGLLSKYTIALLAMAALYFMVLDPKARKWFSRLEPYGALAIGLVLFSPVIFWNAQHQWASFFFQGPQRWSENFDFNLPHLVGAVLVLLTPTGLLAAAVVIISRKWFFPESGDEKTNRTYRLLTATTVIPLSVFVFFSLFRATKLHWTAPLWLGILPYMAASAVPDRPIPAGKLSRYAARAWPATIMFLVILYGAAFHYLVLGFPGVPYFKTGLGVGMQALALEVENLEADYVRREGDKPFTVCMDSDRLAGWIAFYRSKMAGPGNEGKKAEVVHNTTGGHLFGENSHMYRYWHPREAFEDKTLLLIGDNRSQLLSKSANSRLIPLGDIYPIAVQKNSKPAGYFFCQFAKMH